MPYNIVILEFQAVGCVVGRMLYGVVQLALGTINTVFACTGRPLLLQYGHPYRTLIPLPCRAVYSSARIV
jgi:hypothetical protein